MCGHGQTEVADAPIEQQDLACGPNALHGRNALGGARAQRYGPGKQCACWRKGPIKSMQRPIPNPLQMARSLPLDSAADGEASPAMPPPSLLCVVVR